MLRHVVIWTLPKDKDPQENKTNAEKIKSGLEGLRDVAPGVIKVEVNISPLPVPTCNADIILDSLFADEKAFRDYLTHPRHLELKGFIAASVDERLCMDYIE